MLAANYHIHASKGPVIIMNQLKSIYNSPFKDSHSYPTHTSSFPIIASYVACTNYLTVCPEKNLEIENRRCAFLSYLFT